MSGLRERPPVPEALSGNWKWIVALGVVFALAGIVALLSVVMATVASVLIVGVMMIIAGVAEMVNAFRFRGWGRFLLWLALGALYILAGFFVFANPLMAAAVLTLLLGVVLVVTGVGRSVLGFSMRSGSPWGWVVASGVITFGLGVMILLGWPVTSLFVLGTLLGIDLLFTGASWIGLGLGFRGKA